ncbi:hypothetical protein GCM10007276_21220 [Agaricicola taiwanensis]|uniref:DUF3971 domain-containing protein n=1 Tax=Agaricicola taiwanensis TaxID=591372 RepID=A0A8J3DWI7_9RHOB|nr:AsmA-like C-terminal region-containing protein [Agaricicola taiwanensis]GGE43839.1 hypothetical protein GCM10007276_21220 [Agaricicola taiwanensis]
MDGKTRASTESLRKFRRRLLAPVWTGGTALAASVRARVRRLHLSRSERWRRRALYFTGGVLAILGAGYAMLLWTPLPLSVVTPRITAALQQRLGPGFEASIGSARLDRDDQGSAVRLNDFEILDPDGRAVLAVPRVMVSLERSDKGFFSFGFGAPKRVEIEAPRVSLRIEEEGGVLLSGGEELAVRVPSVSVQDAAARPVAELVAALDTVLGPGGPLSALESITISDAHIAVDDRRNGWSEAISDVEGTFVRRVDGGLTASLTSTRPDQRWSASATLNGMPGDERSLDLGFENINVGRVLQSLRPNAGQELQGRLSGHLFAGLGSDGKPHAYEVRLDVAGVVAGNADNILRLDALKLEARWDFRNPRISVRNLSLNSGWGRGQLVMEAVPIDTADPNGGWRYNVAGQDVVLNTATGQAPVYFSAISGDGHLDVRAKKAGINRLQLSSPTINLAGSAALDWNGEKPILDTSIAGVRVPVSALLSLWPPMLAPRTRGWIATNIQTGIAEDLVFAAHGPLVIPPPPPDQPRPRMDVALDAQVTGVEMSPARLPLALTQGHGTIHVANHRLKVNIEGGQLSSPGRGTIDVMPSDANIANLIPRDPEVDLRVNVKGEAATTGRVLSSIDPAASVAFFDKIGGGELIGEVRLRARSQPGGKLEILGKAAQFETEDLSIPDVVGPLDLGKGDFKISLDDAATEVQGDATLGGAPVSISARIVRVDNKMGATTINVTGDPSRIEGMKAMAGISGSAALRLQMASPDTIDGATVEADLSGTRIDIGAASATKAVGQPGRLSFTVRKQDAGIVLEQLDLDAAPIAAKGRIEFDRNGGLSLARMDTVRLSADDDARLDVTPASGGLKFTLRGEALDVRPFIRGIRGRSSPSTGDITVDAKLERAVAFNNEALRDVSFSMSRRGGRLRALTLEAVLGAGKVTARMSEGAQRDILVESNDAGALLRGFDIYRRMRGGGFELVAPSDGAGQGFMAIRDFSIVDEKALASVTAGRREGNQLVVNFSKARVAFRQEQGSLLIQESAVWGPDIGATLDGALDFASDSMSLTGTFVPAYALNNFFARIPIIGALLGGGQYEGLVGVTFKVEGPIGNPTLSVNPVSAVAPGFLRKLFEFRNQDPSVRPGGQAGAPG